MCRRKVAAGASFAGEEQAIVDRFGECLTTVRVTRQRERSSEQICQLGNGEVEEGPLSPPASSSEASLPPK